MADQLENYSRIAGSGIAPSEISQLRNTQQQLERIVAEKAWNSDGKTYNQVIESQDESYGIGNVDKAWKMSYNENTDRKQFEQYRERLGNNAPKTFNEFQRLKYGDDWGMFKNYAVFIGSGELTPLVDFKLYKETNENIDRLLVGKTTSNGIVITGKSNHFIARTIGSIEQRRNGVDVAEALETLLYPDEICPIKTAVNGNSQKFKGPKSFVTINPDTGLLIQVNPRKTNHGEVVR